MNTMLTVIDKELIQYFLKLDQPQKKSLLDLMKSFLKPEEEIFQPVTLEQYNREIDEAMERITKGEFSTLEELEKEMQSW